VRRHTAPQVLDRIDRNTAQRVFRIARGGPEAIRGRLRELDREWDLERWLQINFVTLNALAELKGQRSRAWQAFFRIQELFLLLHATVGWCPPTALLRRLGVRTQKEIDAERAILAELLQLTSEEEPYYEVLQEVVVYEPATATSVGTADRW